MLFAPDVAFAPMITPRPEATVDEAAVVFEGSSEHVITAVVLLKIVDNLFTEANACVEVVLMVEVEAVKPEVVVS